MIALPLWHRLAASTALTLRSVSRERGAWLDDMTNACTAATTVLGMVFDHAGVEARLASGFRKSRRHRDVHCWAQVAGRIVDITATQLGENAIVFCLPVPSSIYQPFEVIDMAALWRGLRNDWPHNLEHPAHPRQHHAVIAETFARVVGMPLSRARRVTTATIGAEVRP